ncbi:MAG: hypothetical protein KDD76_04270, partial [Rickettsiales bacterium]|nr:hypothetical protein [Rickettsiales bacterium]
SAEVNDLHHKIIEKMFSPLIKAEKELLLTTYIPERARESAKRALPGYQPQLIIENLENQPDIRRRILETFPESAKRRSRMNPLSDPTDLKFNDTTENIEKEMHVKRDGGKQHSLIKKVTGNPVAQGFAAMIQHQREERGTNNREPGA